MRKSEYREFFEDDPSDSQELNTNEVPECLRGHLDDWILPASHKNETQAKYETNDHYRKNSGSQQWRKEAEILEISEEDAQVLQLLIDLGHKANARLDALNASLESLLDEIRVDEKKSSAEEHP